MFTYWILIHVFYCMRINFSSTIFMDVFYEGRQLITDNIQLITFKIIMRHKSNIS